MSKVKISKAKIGNGLFAKKDLKKDEVIFIAKGTIIKDTYGEDYKPGPNWMTIKECVWLSPFDSNPWRYINHSCNANAGLKGKVSVVAMKNINKGEEVTIDYSITEDDPYWKMRCNCKSKNCRKTIKSIRFLPKEVFNKYKYFIPKFLKNSYLKNK